MKRLNIVIVSDAINNQLAGSFVSALRFANLLKKRGHKIIIIAAKYPDTKDIENYNGFKTYRFKSLVVPKTEKRFRLAFPKVKQLKKIFIKEKIDIIHVMYPNPASSRAIEAGKELGIKTVAHSHTQPEDIFFHLPKIINNPIIIRLANRYMANIYKKADITICPSKFAEQILKKYNIKTTVISNGVDLNKFKKLNPSRFMKRYSISKNNFNIIFVGRLNPIKNVEILIKAMPHILEKANNVVLNIVGVGFMKEQLEKLAESLNVRNKINFLGRISDNELPLAYNSCDIFVLPSFAELEGMVVLEAMACGKPILIANSKDSSSVDFVSDNGFLFNPRDEKDLAEKIIKIAKNKELLKKMAKKSSAKSRNFDINKSVKKLENLYYSLTASEHHAH